MIDETYRPRWARWAWLLGSLACAFAFGCSANETSPTGEDKDETGGTTSQGGTAGVATGAAPSGGTSGVGGSVTGGTGSGGVSGTSPTGGVGPTGGASGTGTGGATGGVGGTGVTGGTSGTSGASGAGGGGSTLTEPIQRGGVYVLEFGGLYFEVNPAGARVTDVHLAGGMNLLTTQNIDPAGVNFGSTFWPSPQTWGWPPTSSIPQINNGPYAASVASPAVTFVGENAATVGASVTKKFTADLARGNVVVDYTLTATAANKMFAPWEITRVYKRGLTFYPTGTPPRAGGTFQLPPTMDAGGCTWHQAPTANGADQKLLANGTGGWLAHVDGDTVIVKKFPDVAAGMAAPNEDEIEIFVSGSANYIEVEQQGAYVPVAMGQGLTWSVTWIVRRLPQGVSGTVPSPELVAFVQSLVQ